MISWSAGYFFNSSADIATEWVFSIALMRSKIFPSCWACTIWLNGWSEANDRHNKINSCGEHCPRDIDKRMDLLRKKERFFRSSNTDDTEEQTLAISSPILINDPNCSKRAPHDITKLCPFDRVSDRWSGTRGWLSVFTAVWACSIASPATADNEFCVTSSWAQISLLIYQGQNHV